MSQVSTAGRLLAELHRESPALGEMVACGAGILHHRVEGVMRGDVRLTLSEQLRLAEATIVLAPAFASRAARLKNQALAARSFESGDLVIRHGQNPVEPWERATQLRR
jgi:hypothetical protein